MQLIVMTALTLACCFFANSYLNCAENKLYKKSLTMKALASACYAGVGGIAMTGCWYSVFGHLVFAGLCLGLAGDVLLGLRRLYPKKSGAYAAAGAVSFAAANACGIAAFIGLTPKVLYVAAPYAAAGMFFACTYLKKRKVKMKRLAYLGILYELLLLIMGGCAAGGAVFAVSPGTILFAVGGLFLAIADNLLIADMYGTGHSADRLRTSGILYYSARIFTAFSMITLFVI